MRPQRIFIFLVSALVLSLCQTNLFGQPGGGPPGDPIDPDVPITGIEYLLGGGILYGIRSLLNARKSKE